MAYLAATMGAAAAAAAQKRVMDQLRGKLATSHERAAGFVPEQAGDERWLETLLNRGVVVEAGPGRYWLNERTQRRNKSSDRVMLLVGAAAAISLLVIGLTLLL